MYQCFLCFYCQIIFHCVDMPCFVYPFSVRFLAIVNNAVWTLVYMFLCGQMFSIILGIYLPGAELWNHMVILCLTLGELPHCFNSAHTIYIPTSMCLRFLHLLTNTCYFLCFYSFNTHFFVYVLGLRTVLGVGEEEGMRLRLLWRHRQKTVAAGDEWREGWVMEVLSEKDVGQASEEATFMLWPLVPALALFLTPRSPGGVVVKVPKRCHLKSAILAWNSPIRACSFVLSPLLQNTFQQPKPDEETEAQRGNDLPKVTLEGQSPDLQTPAWGAFSSNGVRPAVAWGWG